MNLRVFYLTRRGLSDGYVFCCYLFSVVKTKALSQNDQGFLFR